jgi:uroporphyrinogen decarboxylase
MVVADHAARVAGCRVSAAVTDPAKLAEVLLQAREFYGYDMVLVFADTMVEAEALGCRVAIPEDDDPYLQSPLGRIPDATADPEHAGRMPVVLGAVRELAAGLQGRVPLFASLKGPFSLACFLLGAEEFLVALRADPVRCHEALRFALENQRRYGTALIQAGALAFSGDPMASGDIISPRDFRDFALPYLRELHAALGRLARPVGLHLCGDSTSLLKGLDDTGADILSLDEADLGMARRRLGESVCLMGNVPTHLIASGTPEQVSASARECLEQAGPRLILSSSCDIPRDAPTANVRAIVRAFRNACG